MRRRLAVGSLGSGVVLACTGFAQAATIGVNTTTDELTNNGNCSLREAIISANTDTAVDGCTAGHGTDRIVLPAGAYTISLSTGSDDQSFGDFNSRHPSRSAERARPSRRSTAATPSGSSTFRRPGP